MRALRIVRGRWGDSDATVPVFFGGVRAAPEPAVAATSVGGVGAADKHFVVVHIVEAPILAFALLAQHPCEQGRHDGDTGQSRDGDTRDTGTGDSVAARGSGRDGRRPKGGAETGAYPRRAGGAA